MRPQSAAPRVQFSEKLVRLDNNIREAREARQKLTSSRPQTAQASSSRPQIAPPSAPWSQPRSKPSGVFSKKEPSKKPRGPPVVLAEGRALKPVLWFPGDGVAAIVDRDLDQARAIARRGCLHPALTQAQP